MAIMFVMNETMKEIRLDLSDRLKKVCTSSYRIATNNVKDIFFEEALYAQILNEYSNLPLTVAPDSLFNIFVLLGVEPKKDEQKLKNYYRYRQEPPVSILSDIPITDYPLFLTQNLFNMVQFINLSTYLFKRYEYEQKSKKERTMLMKMLIVSASSMYAELYSSRGKIEFAYFFKKLLENHSNFNASITPYNKESWRGEYAEYTRLAKSDIDTICELSGKQEEVSLISNICIIYGKRIDSKLPHLGERYITEAGIYNHNSQYTRIFIATFS